MITLVLSSNVFANVYKASNHSIHLEKKNGLEITAKCSHCLAKKTLEKLTKKEIKTALEKYSDARVPLSNRLCGGLNGAVWIMRDEKNQETSLCEFSDKSAILSESLAIKYHQIMAK